MRPTSSQIKDAEKGYLVKDNLSTNVLLCNKCLLNRKIYVFLYVYSEIA